jgi:opine dehydrogenase
MSGVNMVVHCAPMLANAGRIESEGGKFEFYYAGMTPAVCRLIEATDRERLAVARAYGLELASTAQTFRNQYGVEGETLYDVLQANPAFAGFAPKTLHHRFLTEDTPYSMVPMAALGRLAGVPTPIMDALIALLGELLGEDYAVTGQTAERMGLAGMTPEVIRNLVSA